jgi:ATP-dependent Clp protease ATP-binding subunit ClpA
MVVETLCRPSKPNPLLLGPAGVGKTAIVEALAQRVVSGQVPAPLRDVRLFALQTSDLVQGTGVVGELEKRMREVVTEAEQPGLILFLDEIHTVVGAGAGGRSANDVANILKPALSRGRMLCIGATTDGEYTRHLSGDAAFERRFQVVRVQELEPAATRAAIEARAAAFGQRSGVTVDGEALDAIIALSGRYLRHRRFPDKAIDVLDQSLARAVVLGLPRCDADLVREVVARVVGLPVTSAERDQRLDRLAREMVERVGLRAEDADRVARRLRVTMANLDLRPGRPNLVVAVPGLPRAARLAQVLAEVLLGDGARVVEEDFSSYTHPADVTRLIGAAPGYVGHDQEPRLHLQLRQQPWSVVLLRAVDHAHPAVQAVLGKALSEGVLRDARGEDTSWADSLCVVGLAAGVTEASPAHTVGFLTPAHGGTESGPATPELDPVLVGCLDLVCGPEGQRAAPPPEWVSSELLEPLAVRWHYETGCTLAWGEGFEQWVAARAEELKLEGSGLERWFEEQVVAALAAAASGCPGARALSVTVGSGGEVTVTTIDDQGEPGMEPAPAS